MTPPPRQTFSVNLTGLGAARGWRGDEVVSILSSRIRPAKWRPERVTPGPESHQVRPRPHHTSRRPPPRAGSDPAPLPACAAVKPGPFPSCTGAAASSQEPRLRSLPSAVIYRERPMIYGPVSAQWSPSLSFARPPDPAATRSQVGEMCANQTLWGLLNRRRGPLMKLVFSSVCMLMMRRRRRWQTLKRPFQGPTGRKVSSPSADTLIYERNGRLAASDIQDVFKRLYGAEPCGGEPRPPAAPQLNNFLSLVKKQKRHFHVSPCETITKLNWSD